MAEQEPDRGGKKDERSVLAGWVIVAGIVAGLFATSYVIAD